MEQIQALRFDIDQVGKHVKGSKKRYTWEISLKDKHHTIILDFSFISGKVKITVDRKILLQNELPSNVSFQYPFTLDGFALNIIQQGQSFELRINNKVFSHLYTQHKTNTQFKKYQDQVKDIKVDMNHLNPQKQKIQLNIGAFGGMHKKKKDVVGGAEGWNAFSGGSFPNYFGQESKNEEKPVSQPQKSNLLDEEETKEQPPVKTEAPKAEINLLGDQPEKPAESIIDITMPSQVPSQIPSQVPPQDDFNTMRNMFATMNVNQPAPQPSNSVDFFASEPKKENPPPQQSAVNFDLHLSSSNQPASNFTTGFAFQSSNIDAKAFSTSAPGNKPLQVDFFNLPPKQDNVNAFSKKTVQQTNASQMENIFSGQPQKPVQSQVSSPLTDMSVNDFMGSKPKESEIQFTQSNMQAPPSAGDFSTLQNFFQTSNPSTIQNMTINQPSQMSGISMGNSSIGQAPNQGDFTTLQQMFQTTNYSNLNNNAPSQMFEQKASVSNPNPSPSKVNANVFATMGGGASAASNFEFDMQNFGTMQANQKNPQSNLDFFSKPAANTSSGGGDLI